MKGYEKLNKWILCVKVPQNAAKGIDISKTSRGSMPPDPPSPLGSQATLERSPSESALDSKDGHFVVENFGLPFSKFLYPPLDIT